VEQHSLQLQVQTKLQISMLQLAAKQQVSHKSNRYTQEECNPCCVSRRMQPLLRLKKNATLVAVSRRMQPLLPSLVDSSPKIMAVKPPISTI